MYRGGLDIDMAVRLIFVLAVLGSLGTLVGLAFGAVWLAQHVSVSFH